MSIELTDVKNKLASEIRKHVSAKRQNSKFDIDFEFENESGMFSFRGSWNFTDESETAVEINIREGWIQYPDFESEIPTRYISKLEKNDIEL